MSADDDTPENPHDAAIDWVVRMKEGTLSRKEQAAFEAWLAADPAHAAAYEDIEQLSADLSDLRLPGRAKPARVSRRKLQLASAAAIATTTALLALTFGDLSAFLLSDYDTGTGETRQLILEDGSHVEINAKSAIALHFTSTQRRLTLLRGEAWFDVTPNPARPFAVEAMGGTVTALGTSFDIARGKRRNARDRHVASRGGRERRPGNNRRGRAAKYICARCPGPRARARRCCPAHRMAARQADRGR